MKKVLPLFFLIGLFSGNVNFSQAQISQGGTPRSFQKLVSNLDVPIEILPGVDIEKLREEDTERKKLGKEFDRRFGHNFYVGYNTENSGVWKSLPNGDRIWQLKIKSENALSINLTFSTYNLPEGADLFIIGKENKIGALTRFNNQADEKLGTGLILGNEVLVEYFEPLAQKGKGKLQIGRATHGYRNPFSILGWGGSDNCEMNVNCPQGAAWQLEKRAVARITDGGDICTGTLINNVLQDGKPYFLTANHCFSNNSSTWVFSFNWEAPACQTPTNPIPENQTISGCTLKSRNSPSDFCLFELSSKPPASFNAYYAGWNAVDAPASSTTIIHHPAGDIKKITFDFDPAVSSGYGVNSTNDNSHWRTMAYDLNTTTEGGSSGSALFDQNHRIVGQLHGGPASCTNISSDFYGKFSMSWASGTTPATRIKDWLDPLNSGLLVLDGIDPACNRLSVKLPWKKNLDTVVRQLPQLWKVKNPNADSTFRLVSGGYSNVSGKAFKMDAEGFSPSGRSDTLIISPISVSNYKKIKLRFNHAYRRKSSSASDILNLMVSRDCGSTYKPLVSLTGQALETVAPSISPVQFFPTDTVQWMKNEIQLDSTFNKAEQLVFAFGFVSGNSGTLWLDEIQVVGDTSKSKPLAIINSDKVTGCPGVQIQFADSSRNNPSSRVWRFQGGVPATSTSPNPLVTYNSTGNFKVSLLVTNEEGTDSSSIEGFVNVVTIGQTVTPFVQDFSAAGPFPPAGYLLVNPQANVTWTQNQNVNAPGSNGGSMMFDNYSNPNVSPQKDNFLLPRISTAGKSHLKLKLKYAYAAYSSFGGIAPDTFTIGFTKECGGNINKLWKKGGLELATAGTTGNRYVPQDADWQLIQMNLDSLLAYPELSFSFENQSGFGNQIFLDDIYIDTIDNCPNPPVLTVNTDTICVGKTLVLAMDSIQNATYSWTGPLGFGANTRVANRLISQNTMSGFYRGTVTKENCTSAPSSINILASSNPLTPTISQNGNQLTGPNNFVYYLWIVNGDTLDANTQTITAPVSGVYILWVFNAAGCSRSSNPRTVVITSANEEIRNGTFSAFPNPTTGMFEIKALGQNELKVKDIFNSLGVNVGDKVIIQKTGEKMQLNFSRLPSGIYHISLSSSKEIKTLRVVKQ